MNYFIIVISIVSAVISIGAAVISIFQVKVVKTVASPIPFLEFIDLKFDGPLCTYILVNKGPGHAKNIKFYLQNNNKENFVCNGPSFLSFTDLSPEIEYRYDGPIAIHGTWHIVIEYENMTGYKMKNVWILKNGKFQVI